MQVAWLYNIRGSDVSYCPVVHAFAIVTLSSAFFYVDKRKVSDEVCQDACAMFCFVIVMHNKFERKLCILIPFLYLIPVVNFSKRN